MRCSITSEVKAKLGKIGSPPGGPGCEERNDLGDSMDEEKHLSNERNDKKKLSVDGLLGTYLYAMSKTCKLPSGFFLTNDTLAAYRLALENIPVELLERALIRCDQECEWFPSAFEIRQRAENAIPAAEARRLARQVNEARQRFERGEDAPQLKSVTDDEVRLLAGQVLSRKDLLRLGFEKPRELSPIEKESRIAELKAQAEYLK